MTSHDLIHHMKSLICQAFKVYTIEIIDDSHKHAGHAQALGGKHFRLLLVSQDFEGKTRLERQRSILTLFQDMMPHRIHALSIQAITPQEFQKWEG